MILYIVLAFAVYSICVFLHSLYEHKTKKYSESKSDPRPFWILFVIYPYVMAYYGILKGLKFVKRMFIK